ncbi:hypothetical protein SAMN04488144_1597 [Methylobacterium sp. 190mf]|nr:hypothetical protein SAMN04488144_1597 [Methylobacterium sp. 190mf]
MGWLQVVIGVAGLLLPFLPVLRRSGRRQQRTVRYSHWKIGGIERTRLDLIDDSQSWSCPWRWCSSPVAGEPACAPFTAL